MSAPVARSKDASAGEPEKKKEGEAKVLAEAEIAKLIPKSFHLEPAKRGEWAPVDMTEKEVISELFLSNDEFRGVARQVISQAVTPAMDEVTQKSEATKALTKLVTERYQKKLRLVKDAKALSERDVKAGVIHAFTPIQITAMIKAEELFAKCASSCNIVEFAGEKAGVAYMAYRKDSRSPVRLHEVVQAGVAAGGEGVVSKVREVSSGVLLAMKKVPPSKSLTRDRQIKQLEKGVAHLRAADAANDLATVVIGETFVGYVMPWHDVDMISMLKNPEYRDYTSQLDRQRYLGQICKQQFDLLKKGIWNLDIKPDNIMLHVERESKGAAAHGKRSSAKLIDLDLAFNLNFKKEGDVIDPDKVQKILADIAFFGGTPRYTSPADLELYLENLSTAQKLQKEAASLPRKLNVEGQPINWESDRAKKYLEKSVNFIVNYQKVLEQRMIFTLGATFFSLLCGRMPYSRAGRIVGMATVDDFANLEDQEAIKVADQDLLALGYSEKVVSFFRTMMDPDPNKRPTKDQVQATVAGFKFPTQEGMDKLGITENLKIEAEGTELEKRGVTLSDLENRRTDWGIFEDGEYVLDDGSITDDLRKQGYISRTEFNAVYNELGRLIEILRMLPTIKQENRKHTDFNPYIAQPPQQALPPRPPQPQPQPPPPPPPPQPPQQAQQLGSSDSGPG